MKNIFATTFLSILLFFIFTATAEAENPVVSGTISGKVVDAISGEPMPYVNVVVRDIHDSIITGGITDEEGEFNIAGIPVGRSNVEIQFMGYETIEKKIEISQESRAIEFSTVQLTEDSQQLEEVTVRGEVSTVTQKIDRKVINVGKDLTATGTNASELLNHVQSVSVDQQTGAVSLRGNENVRIFIDGKPSTVSPAQLLKQIPSSSIKSIELITNPSAKYSPEGMSGIINIVLYKNSRRGLNGSVDAGATAGENLRYNGAADLNFSRGKVNVYANYGGNYGKSKNGGSLQLPDRGIHTERSDLSDRTSHLLKTGLDLFIDEKNTFSVYTLQNFYDHLQTSNTDIFYNDIIGSENIQYINRDNYSGTYNMNYLHSFSENNHYIEFEGTYSSIHRNELGDYTDHLNPDNLTSNYMDDAIQDLNNTLFNLDYTKVFTEDGKLEAGLEYRFDGTRNNYISDRYRYVRDDNGTKIPDGEGYLTAPEPNSSFIYDRYIYSAYTTYGHQFGSLSTQVGLRVEQYDVNAEFNEGDGVAPYIDNKFTAYPSAFVTYAPGEKNQFQLSYSRRVDRPGISQVNPIREPWSSPLVTFVGNPELKPQFTNSYEFNYSRKTGIGTFSVGTFFRRINDNIIRYSNPDPFDVEKTEVTYANAEGENRYGAEFSAMVRPVKWWNINASSDVYYQTMTGYAFGELVEVESVATNVRINNSFSVSDNISIQLFAMYRGANEVIQYIFKPMYMVNAGFSWDILDDHGTISIRVNDIFDTMRFRLESTNYYTTSGEFYWESRTANLSFSYHFKSGEVKTRKRKQRDSRVMSDGEGF